MISVTHRKTTTAVRAVFNGSTWRAVVCQVADVGFGLQIAEQPQRGEATEPDFETAIRNVHEAFAAWVDATYPEIKA